MAHLDGVKIPASHKKGISRVAAKKEENAMRRLSLMKKAGCQIC